MTDAAAQKWGQAVVSFERVVVCVFGGFGERGGGVGVPGTDGDLREQMINTQVLLGEAFLSSGTCCSFRYHGGQLAPGLSFTSHHCCSRGLPVFQ